MSSPIKAIRRALRRIEETAAELDNVFRRAALRRPGELVITEAEQKACAKSAQVLVDELNVFGDLALKLKVFVEG